MTSLKPHNAYQSLTAQPSRLALLLADITLFLAGVGASTVAIKLYDFVF